MKNSLNFLSTKQGFNVALRHFKLVNGFIKSVGSGRNVADLINSSYEEKKIDQFQYGATLNVMLVQKFKYTCKSHNLKSTVNDLNDIQNKLAEISKFDLVFSYFHPQLGQVIINPKNKESWESLDALKENELLVIYVGDYANEYDAKLANDLINSIIDILNGKKVSLKKFSGDSTGSSVEQKPVKTAEKPVEKAVENPIKADTASNQPSEAAKETQQVSQGKKTLSTQYGVLVSNELFHNGNVEAWKRIIASYESKYPNAKVLVFYEGEQILDINTLFKWGKVKHGTNIYFRLLGTEHTDISKLRRYLLQGASNRFEDFLKGDPTKMLKLF